MATRKRAASKPANVNTQFACLNCGAVHKMPALDPEHQNAEFGCFCGFRHVFTIKGNAINVAAQTGPLPQHVESVATE